MVIEGFISKISRNLPKKITGETVGTNLAAGQTEFKCHLKGIRTYKKKTEVSRD